VIACCTALLKGRHLNGEEGMAARPPRIIGHMEPWLASFVAAGWEGRVPIT